MLINKIKYVGNSVYADNDPYKGRELISQNKVYNLGIGWNGSDINGHWIFYLYDNLNDDEMRGYEINVKDVKDLRTSNLNIILEINE